MGTTADKLNYLKETQEAIKTALIDKGVEVSDGDTFRSYAEKISNISSGGGSEETEDISLFGSIVLPNISDYSTSYANEEMQNILNSYTALYRDEYGLTEEHPLKIKFQNKLTSLPSYGFSGFFYIICDLSECPNLEILPEKFFYTCGSIEVLLPEGLKEIHNNVFQNDRLDSLYIPNSVEIILEEAFSMCTIGTIYIDKEPGSIEGAPWGYEDESKIVWLRS